MMTERRVWVSMDVFEGSAETWAKLKVGDVLRVEAEDDKYMNEFRNENVPWKATEAILVSKASCTSEAMSRANEVAKTDAVREALKMRKEFEVRQCVRAHLHSSLCVCVCVCACVCVFFYKPR
jgi:hypothetical protein